MKLTVSGARTPETPDRPRLAVTLSTLKEIIMQDKFVVMEIDRVGTCYVQSPFTLVNNVEDATRFSYEAAKTIATLLKERYEALYSQECRELNKARFFVKYEEEV